MLECKACNYTSEGREWIRIDDLMMRITGYRTLKSAAFACPECGTVRICDGDVNLAKRSCKGDNK